MSINEFKELASVPSGVNSKLASHDGSIDLMYKDLHNIHAFTIRCGFCDKFEPNNGKSILLDFKEQEIYYNCGNCKKDNSIKLKAQKPSALPRIRTGRS